MTWDVLHGAVETHCVEYARRVLWAVPKSAEKKTCSPGSPGTIKEAMR